MNTTIFFNSIIKLQNILQTKNFSNSINQFKANLDNFSRHKRANTTNSRQQVITLNTQINTQINKIKSDYVEIKKNIDSVKLNLAFSKLSLDNIDGIPFDEFISNISDTIDQNHLAITNSFNKYHQQLNYLTQLNSLSQNMSLGIDKVHETFSSSDGLSIFFRKGASVEFLDELSDASRHWKQIINCFGRLANENDNKSRIESIHKGSIVMTITVATGIVLAIAKASNSILDTVLKFYEVKKKSLELKSLNLDNIEKAISILDKQSKLNVKKEAERISDDLLKEYNIEDNETRNALVLSVKRIIKFTNKGGKLEPILSQSTLDKNKELVDSVIEKNKKLIEVEGIISSLKDGEGILQLEEDSLDSN